MFKISPEFINEFKYIFLGVNSYELDNIYSILSVMS